MHDPRFKRLLQEFFAEFFWLFFPDWAERFDFGSIEWLDKELVSDVLEGESRYVDVVAKLATRQPVSAPDGRSAESWQALVHVEIEAADTVAPLRHCPEKTYRKVLLCECVSAYLPTDEEQRRQFEEMVRNHPDSGVQAMELGLLDHVEQRGVERGRQEGKLEGKLEGQRDLLREQLEERFGPLSSAVLDRLQTWPADRLTESGRALLSAASPEELGLTVSETGDS